MIEAKIPSGPIERQLVTGRSEITPLDLDARIPLGPIEQKWDKCRFDMKLVNPANRRKHSIIVVGAGLAGAAAAATLDRRSPELQTGFKIQSMKRSADYADSTDFSELSERSVPENSLSEKFSGREMAPTLF
jgi:hypothetical protein